MDISDEFLRRRKHIRDAHGRVRPLPPDGIIPDGWSVVVPLGLKDGEFGDVETPSDDYFAQLPREFTAKRFRAEGLLRSGDQFLIESGIASLERLAREAELLAEGGSLPWGCDPASTRAAAARAAQYCAGLAEGGRYRLSGLRGRPVEREPETAEEAHALMCERNRNAWRTGQ
jgi:hypothetical protein